jgi:cell division protein FtsB
MLLRARIRAVLYPLAFYAVLGGATGYLEWDAFHGQRGLKAKAEFANQMRDLDSQLKALKDERQSWERRVALMRPEAADRDLLDEESRTVLGRIGKNDLVVFTGQSSLR